MRTLMRPRWIVWPSGRRADCCGGLPGRRGPRPQGLRYDEERVMNIIICLPRHLDSILNRAFDALRQGRRLGGDAYA